MAAKHNGTKEGHNKPSAGEKCAFINKAGGCKLARVGSSAYYEFITTLDVVAWTRIS